MTEGSAAGRDESRALTGLRGVAALLVLAHHLYLRLAIDQHLPMVQAVLRKGYLGVDIFFVLSGFVMSMVYAPWFAAGGQARAATYGVFLVRRVARLWPLHAAVLAVLVGFGVDPPHNVLSVRLVAANLAMIQAWAVSTEINPPAWSVSTEFLAYLLFPALSALVFRSRAGWIGCVALVAGALAVCLTWSPPVGAVRRGVLDIYYNHTLLPALRCLAGFMIGMLAWRAGQAMRVRAVAALPWVGPAALAAVLGMMLGRVNDMLILLVIPLVVLGLHWGRGPGHRLLASGPLHGLGVLSYAVYLIHFTMLTLFPFGYAPLRIMLPLYLGCTVLLAMAAHRLIELPGRRLIRAAGERAVRAGAGALGLAPAFTQPLRDRPH